MLQKITKYGDTSTDYAKVIITDKFGNVKKIGASAGAIWGLITGTLSAQTDLISYLTTTYFPIPTGTISQYIDGTGALQTFPTIPTVTPSALTKTDDTNITLTLSGTPATALLQAVGIAVGWTGTLADSRIASASNWNSKQAGSSNLTSLSALSYVSTSFVKMTAAGTFALDTNTYLTGITSLDVTTALGYTPVTNARTLTINGVTYDLSADRSWTISAGTGTVSSVGLSMPSAFTVTNSPVTTSGTLTVTGAGTISQYIRGDGTLANFPNSTGGGASVNYYLNGSVSQGTFGGNTYYQMSKTPILGTGTNFTRTNGAGNGYIASFITDVGDPSFLNIPGGNWNLEFYFQSSASGGSPQFYGEIYKVSATNVFTLIASGSVNPEGITNGTTIDQYYTSIPVPQTTLLITDRLAIRIYVITGGRTITLHTENGNLCEVLTTFTTGLTALNGLTQQVQYFDEGISGTDFNISSTTDTHTFNLPTASATNRGALSSANWSSFATKTFGAVFDGGGSVISAGTQVDVIIPVTMTIVSWTMIADVSGSAIVELWKDTYVNYPPTIADKITASAPPTITTATKNTSSTLTGWTTTVNAGDIVRFNVNSATSITKLTLSIQGIIT
jgi:hypothetical protein